MTKPTPERTVEEIVEEFEMNFISLGVGSVDNPPKKLRTYLKELLQAERQKCEEMVEAKDDLLDDMWGLICNVNGGIVEKERPEWYGAFLRIRTKYFSQITHPNNPK